MVSKPQGEQPEFSLRVKGKNMSMYIELIDIWVPVGGMQVTPGDTDDWTSVTIPKVMLYPCLGFIWSSGLRKYLI